MRDPDRQRAIGAGKKAATGGADDTTIGGHFHSPTHVRLIDADRHATQRHNIRNQNASADGFCAQHRLERVGRKMMTVGDECGSEAVFRKLCPQQVRMTRQGTAEPITEMGGERSSGVRGCINLRRRCIAVADGDDNSFIGKRRNEPKSGSSWGDTVTMPTKPSHAACQRLNSARFADERGRDRGRRVDHHSAK